MRPIFGALIAWALYLGILVLYLSMLVFMLATLTDAVSLSISGHSSGQGIQNMTYVGDLLNVSILQNGTGWNISLNGGMA